MQSLDEFVAANVPDNLVHMIPVVEKEVIQYDVFDALEELGLIDKLVFHGGTCLRLCYGGQRRSEDLDFAYGGKLDELDLAALGSHLDSTLGKTFGLTVNVKSPCKTVEFSHPTMQRWWQIVDTAPARPDLPSQRLRIEVSSVKTLTREVRKIARNYDFLSSSAGLQLAVCESREEIMADKLVAFVNTDGTYIRRRDLWDLLWLLSSATLDLSASRSMIGFKKEMYGCSLCTAEFSQEGVKRAREVGNSRSFAAEMARFMPHGTFDAMLGSDMKREYAIEQVCELYRSVAE